MMEGPSVLSSQQHDEVLGGSVADAIASRDQEIRELWSLVEKKDADLRAAAELGEGDVPFFDPIFAALYRAVQGPTASFYNPK